MFYPSFSLCLCTFLCAKWRFADLQEVWSHLFAPDSFKRARKEATLPWPSATSSCWRQTFLITPITKSSATTWMCRDTWVEFKQDIPCNWFETWQKQFPAQQSCSVCFHLCSSALWTFLALWLPLSLSISFLLPMPQLMVKARRTSSLPYLTFGISFAEETPAFAHSALASSAKRIGANAGDVL